MAEISVHGSSAIVEAYWAEEIIKQSIKYFTSST
jgi:hypothetical protein